LGRLDAEETISADIRQQKLCQNPLTHMVVIRRKHVQQYVIPGHDRAIFHAAVEGCLLSARCVIGGSSRDYEASVFLMRPVQAAPP
jgi:hypothetical protein